MFPPPKHAQQTLPSTNSAHFYRSSLALGFSNAATQQSITEQLMFNLAINESKARMEKERPTSQKKKGTHGARNAPPGASSTKFSNPYNNPKHRPNYSPVILEAASSLQYDPSMTNATQTTGGNYVPIADDEYTMTLAKARRDRLEILATPQVKKKKGMKHSLSAVLGVHSRDAFSPILGASHLGSLTQKQTEGSEISDRLRSDSMASTPGSGAGSRTLRDGRLGTSHSTHSDTPGNSFRRPRRVSVDFTATSNSVPLMALHNTYKLQKIKRSAEHVEHLRKLIHPELYVPPAPEEPDYVPPPDLLDQLSPRSANPNYNAGFTRLVGTFYDSDLESMNEFKMKRHEEEDCGDDQTSVSTAAVSQEPQKPQDPATDNLNAGQDLPETLEQDSIVSVPSVESTHSSLKEVAQNVVEDVSAKKMPTVVNSAMKKQLMTKKERLFYASPSSKDLFCAEARKVNNVMSIMSATEIVEHGKHEEHDDNDPEDTIKMYLKEILARGRAPLSLVLKQRTIRSLNLTGFGSGDDYGEAVSFCLPQLTHLTELLLSDNRFTDKSLVPLIKSAQKMPALVKLDLSKNDLDKLASAALRDLLVDDSCILEELNMEHTDVDDEECCSLARALTKNGKLRILNLSNNLIGKSELLNACMPDLETGPEALADMLKVNKSLLHLDLSWNSIRGDSAVTLAAAIAFNTSITTLNLANNALSCAGSQELGRALFKNNAIASLNLSYNQVSIKGAMVIASALKANNTLTDLKLDGNVVGRLGSESLVSALRENASADTCTTLSLVECDCVLEDLTIFDPQFPTKPSPEEPMDMKRNPPYVLDLNVPYGYMVAQELLRLANSKDGCRFISISHQPPPTAVVSGKKTILRPKKPVKVKLERNKEEATDVDKMAPWKQLAASINSSTDGGFDPLVLEKSMTSCGLNPSPEILDFIIAKIKNKMDASLDLEMDEDLCWDVVLRAVFEFVDEDGSGELDADEMLECLAEIGVTPSREVVTQVIAEYDVDDTGRIEVSEFVAYMLAKYASEAPGDLPDLVDTKTGIPWEIPADGILTCEFEGHPSPPTADQIGTDEGINNLIANIESAHDEEERRKLFQVATRDSSIYLTAAQAKLLVDKCNHGFSHLEAIKMLLPQMCSSQEAVRLVETNLSWEDKLKLRIGLGQGWKPIMGMLSGHYDLDLGDRFDRIAAKKLSEQATLESRFSKTDSARMDTSQSGNWENFRNGTIDGAKKVISSSFFNRPSTFGIVRFDYVCTSRPRKGAQCMGAEKFDKLLKNMDLSLFENEPTFWKEHVAEGDIREHWKGWMLTTHYQFTIDRAYAERRRIDEMAAAKAAKADKGKKGKKGKKAKKAKEEEGGGGDNPGFDPILGEQEMLPQEVLDGTHFFLVQGEREKERKVLYPYSDFTGGPSKRYRAYYCALLSIEVALTGKVLNAMQAWRIISQFPADEDGIRVEACAVVFPRVVDIENFAVEVQDRLTEAEQRELVWRIGNAHLFNPINCDRKYWFDFTTHDDRQVMINLVKLGVVEEGNNIRRVEYRRYWHMDPVDGLGIPVAWSEDPDQIPKDCGEVICIYRTGGKNRVDNVEEGGEGGEEEEEEEKSQCESGENLSRGGSVDDSMQDSRATIRLQAAEELAMSHGVGSHANFAFRSEMFRDCFCGTKAVY